MNNTISLFEVFIEYFTTIVTELELRFSSSQLSAFKLQHFLPRYIDDLKYEIIADALDRYASIFIDTSKTAVDPELKRWKNRVRTEYTCDDSISVLLTKFGTDKLLQSFYPTVYTALKILATLPVTTATAER